MILQHNGLAGVPVNPSPGGPLSDHYDPRNRTVNLSQEVYSGRSVASVAIAAHEVGHAIQHEKAYGPFKVRSAMAPAVGFASSTWFILFVIAIFAQISGLATFAIILFAVVVLFQIVTLPVEFDASRRAKQQLSSLGLVTSGEAERRQQGAQRRSVDLRRGRPRRPDAAHLPHRLPPLAGARAAVRTCPPSGCRARRGRVRLLPAHRRDAGSGRAEGEGRAEARDRQDDARPSSRRRRGRPRRASSRSPPPATS